MIGFTEQSGNHKTGPIPVSRSVSSTCPTGCAFLKVCYASYGPGSWHWKRLDNSGGMPWEQFLHRVKALWKGTLWRHNESGDLPHVNGTINRKLVRELTAANKGKMGFTYTHHVLNEANLKTLREANDGGFTINISCETVEQVDAVRRLGLPAVLVVDKPLEKGATTPDGHPLRGCPAEWSNITCSRCGLCQRRDRASVYVFHAHGSGTKHIIRRLALTHAATAHVRARLRNLHDEKAILGALVEMHNITQNLEN